MAVSLTTRINITASRTYKNVPVATNRVLVHDDSNTWLYQMALAYGSGEEQANKVYHTTETLASGASVLFDVAGTLVDAFGSTITMTGVKVLCVKHLGDVGTLVVGGGSNAITSFWGANGDGVKVGPEGCFGLITPGYDEYSASGYAVTASTAENIRVLHSGDTASDISFEIVIMGVG